MHATMAMLSIFKLLYFLASNKKDMSTKSLGMTMLVVPHRLKPILFESWVASNFCSKLVGIEFLKLTFEQEIQFTKVWTR